MRFFKKSDVKNYQIRPLFDQFRSKFQSIFKFKRIKIFSILNPAKQAKLIEMFVENKIIHVLIVNS